MKYRFVIYVMLLAFSSTSCISNRVESVEPCIDLAFDVIVTASTKNGEAVTEYPVDVPFGVWSYSLPADKTWSSDSEEALPVQVQEKVEYDSSSNLWKPQSNMEWLDSENDMSFFAYSPYSVACSFSKEHGLAVADFSIDEGCDLMFSESVYDLNKMTSNGIVSIPFVRALTKVELQIRSSLPDGTIIKVKQLRIKDVATKADFFSLPYARWENLEEHSDILFYDGEMEIDNEPLLVGEGRYMIPQMTMPVIEMVCDIMSDEHVLHDQLFQTSGRMNWGIGKTCTYNLKVTTDLEFIIESSLYE